MFIKATACISPQQSFATNALPAEVFAYTGNRLSCIEPDYKNFIDPKMIRRMSRIIRFGSTAALQCLQSASLTMPDAIVTGTAYGCLEDTGLFMNKMISQQEEMLTPTAFIQSTHNTVGAQIALMLHCEGYNNVFVHRDHSFEHALLDGMMLLNEGDAGNVLIGGVDEITNASHTILSRFGLYKKETLSSIDLFTHNSKGTIDGEGAAFFLLDKNASGNDLAKLDAVYTFYRPGSNENAVKEINEFLQKNNIVGSDIDLLILGKNGDVEEDKRYDDISGAVFGDNAKVNYKQLCGDYPTSTSFALWMAALMLKNNDVPAYLEPTTNISSLKKVLIYNQSGGIHHSLLLLSAC